MSNIREVIESPLDIGPDEEVAYVLDTAPWGGSPSAVNEVVLIEFPGETDVSATMLTGTNSLSGDDITTKKLKGLTEGNWYRLEIKFTISGNVFEAYCRFNCK